MSTPWTKGKWTFELRYPLAGSIPGYVLIANYEPIGSLKSEADARLATAAPALTESIAIVRDRDRYKAERDELEKELRLAMSFIGMVPHHVFKYPNEVVEFYERNAKYAPQAKP